MILWKFIHKPYEQGPKIGEIKTEIKFCVLPRFLYYTRGTILVWLESLEITYKFVERIKKMDNGYDLHDYKTTSWEEIDVKRLRK